jgi:hypothetical protein
MLEKITAGILNSPWLLAIGTVAFFLVKGMVWVVAPYLLLRWRHSSFRTSKKSSEETSLPLHASLSKGECDIPKTEE